MSNLCKGERLRIEDRLIIEYGLVNGNMEVVLP